MAEAADTATITEDHACAHCGYNLRGLARNGRCPECFSLIGPSLRGDLLKHADPVWLDRLRFGTVLKLWNIGISILVGISAAILVFAGLPRELFGVLAFVGGGFGLWASFVITTQEPRISLQEDTVTWRRAIRVCAAVGLAGTALEQTGQGGALPKALSIMGQALGLVGLVAMFGELLYFRRFALRIPAPRLARSTRIVMWGGTVTLACVIIGGIATVLLGVAPPGAGPAGGASTAGGAPGGGGVGLATIVGFTCFLGLSGFVFLVWYVGLLVQYKHAFTTAAAESRATASL